jgi:hypothetical protein
MSYIADRVAAVVAEHGEAMTLRRAGEADLPLKGKRVLMRATEVDIGGTAGQQNFFVRITPAELAASSWAVKEPKRKDGIVIDGRVRIVEDVRPVGDGGVLAMYHLEVTG